MGDIKHVWVEPQGGGEGVLEHTKDEDGNAMWLTKCGVLAHIFDAYYYPELATCTGCLLVLLEESSHGQ